MNKPYIFISIAIISIYNFSAVGLESFSPTNQLKEASLSLHQAIKEHNTALAALFITAGADVNIPEHDGNTPLHEAAMSPDLNYEIITLLLAFGADPNSKNRSGQTPLDYIAANIQENFFLIKKLLHLKEPITLKITTIKNTLLYLQNVQNKSNSVERVLLKLKKHLYTSPDRSEFLTAEELNLYATKPIIGFSLKDYFGKTLLNYIQAGEH